MNFQHEKTDKIIKNHDFNAKNHDFERNFLGVAHFFVILTVYPKMPKDGVYKKRSNPKNKRSIRIVIIQRVNLIGPVKNHNISSSPRKEKASLGRWVTM